MQKKPEAGLEPATLRLRATRSNRIELPGLIEYVLEILIIEIVARNFLTFSRATSRVSSNEGADKNDTPEQSSNLAR